MKTQRLKKAGCFITIREGFTNIECQAVTSIEIIPDDGWKLDGKTNLRVTKEVSE
jgi:hypothetical protein